MSDIADRTEEYSQDLVIHYFTGGTVDDASGVPAEGLSHNVAGRLRAIMLPATEAARDFWTHKKKRDAAIAHIVDSGVEEDEASRLFSFALQKIKKAVKGEISLPRPPVLSTKPWWQFW